MIRVKRASFNGIEFNIIATGITGGHKQSTHEFNNNKTSVQQHGIKHKTYALSAIFIGNNALLQANKLITELDNRGAGVLVHPYLGELNVALQSHKTNIDTRKNLTTIELNFIQQDEVNLLNTDFHSLLIDTISQAKRSVIISTINAIDQDSNKQQTILDMASNINPLINESNLHDTLTDSINIAPAVIQSANPTTLTFNAQHGAINIASGKIGKQYHSMYGIINDASHINKIFDAPLVSSSNLSNDFYNLKTTLARYLIETNLNLPKLKQHSTNTPLPSNVLSHQLGTSVDGFNTNIHPLFNDEQVSYVS